MKKFNLSDIRCEFNEVSTESLNKINGGHYIKVNYYTTCNGKLRLLKSNKQYADNCKCNTYLGSLDIYY